MCFIEDEPLGDVGDALEVEMPALHEQMLMFEKAQRAAEEANKAARLSKQSHNRGFSYTFTYGAGWVGREREK